MAPPQKSGSIIEAFSRIGTGVVLITHDHQLERHLQRRNVINAQQLVLDNDEPNLKIALGVATSSHALRVAATVGFTPAESEAA